MGRIAARAIEADFMVENIAVWIQQLRLLGGARREIVLLAVQSQSTDWGITLSPYVSVELVDLVEARLSEVAGWLGETTRYSLTKQ
jgi:hypothetical protein